MICCTYQQNLYLYTKITKLLPIIMPLHTLDRHLQVNSSVQNKRVCTFFFWQTLSLNINRRQETNFASNERAYTFIWHTRVGL